MTLPTDIILPLETDLIKSGDPDSLELYMRNLIDTLTDMYQQLAQNVNGFIREWTPIVFGTTSDGTGTYDHAGGFYLRQGIIVDVWYDVQWTAHTGTGNVGIKLPYKAANATTVPWEDVCGFSTLNLGAYSYLTSNVDPDSFDMLFVRNGSGLARQFQPIAGAGRLLGHARYIGKELEN